MVSKKNNIPPFVKSLGAQFFAYSLDLPIEDAEFLLSGELELSIAKKNVLIEILETCRKIRKAANINELSYSTSDLKRTLKGAFKDKEHFLNIWRSRSGNNIVIEGFNDELINEFALLGIQIFPTFLFNEERLGMRDFSVLNFNSEKLNKLVQSDSSLTKLFNHKNSDISKVFCAYRNSIGLNLTTQLEIIISNLFQNAYVLMLMEGRNSISDYQKYIGKVITMLRELGENRIVRVPIWVGYSNVSFPSDTKLETEDGSLLSFDPNILDLIPKRARPAMNGLKHLALVHKYSFDYSIELIDKDFDKNRSKKLPNNWGKIHQIDEDLRLSVIFSVERIPPVGMSKQWTMIFDPLGCGMNISFWDQPIHAPTTFYHCHNNDVSEVRSWWNRIREIDSVKINLAKRKLSNAVSYRKNPADSFIDAVICWENLFGAMGELSFRISMGIAFLLESDPEKRAKLQKEVNKHYNIRSKILHGVKEIKYEDLKNLRDFSLDITIKCLKTLFKDHPKLISQENRSNYILMNNVTKKDKK